MTRPAITMAPASCDAGAGAPLAKERSTYRYVGDGRFLPANQAALDECERFNAWADEVNARASGSRRP